MTHNSVSHTHDICPSAHMHRFHYTWLAWLPTYLTTTLSVDLTSAAHTALLPPMAGIAASAAAGVCGDGLLKLGVPTHIVRK